MEAKFNEESIKALIQKVRIFNKDIGTYQMYAITENFDYAVKITNGRLTIRLEDLQGDENDTITPERLKAIADSFKSDTANATSAEPVKTVESKPIQPPIEKPKKSNYKTLVFAGLIAILIILVLVAQNQKSSPEESSSPVSNETYQEKVMSVEEMERAEPVKFLHAEAQYNENFWGNKIKIRGKITNSATTATFKDATIRITYYSKTNTELGSTENTIYETLPPTSSVNFELKIDNYKDVSSIGVDIVNASNY